MLSDTLRVESPNHLTDGTSCLTYVRSSKNYLPNPENLTMNKNLNKNFRFFNFLNFNLHSFL